MGRDQRSNTTVCVFVCLCVPARCSEGSTFRKQQQTRRKKKKKRSSERLQSAITPDVVTVFQNEGEKGEKGSGTLMLAPR